MLYKIIIKSRKQAFSLFSGNRYSKNHSDGLNFEELREYQIGDNVKRIDYNITAKAQKPFVKVFSDEKELNIIITAIFDYKTYFGSKILKNEKMLEIISTLAFSGIKSQDRITLELFGRKKLYSKPTKHLKGILGNLAKFDIECKNVKIDYHNVLNSLLKHKKNSVLIIISDFLFYDDIFKKLGSKFDTYAVIVRDKLEENPELLNGINIANPLTNQISEASFDDKYKNKILKHDIKIMNEFKKANIKYMKFYTQDNILKLRRLFG